MNGIGVEKKLTVCVYLSGTSSARAFKVLEALHATAGLGARWDAIVGIDSISYDLAHFTCERHERGSKVTFIETKDSVGRDRFFLSMVANIRSHYTLLLDEHVTLRRDWIERVEHFLSTEQSFSIAGVEMIRGGQDVHHGQSGILPLSKSAILVSTSFLRTCEGGLDVLPGEKEVAFFDSALKESLGVDQIASGNFDLRAITLTCGGIEREKAPVDVRPMLSACICTYGDHPELILRCLDSILREPLFANDMEIIVGCNAVSKRVMGEIEQRYKRDRITALIRAPINYNKAGIQRFTFRLARGMYLLSLDDDMYFLPGWFPRLKKFIIDSHPFEAAGRLYELSSRRGWSGKKKPYRECVERKKWWRGKLPFDELVQFPAGQCFLARRAFVVENDYPDLGMRIDWDDVLLGDMIIQLDGSQKFFSDDLYKHIIIDDIASRGQHGGG